DSGAEANECAIKAARKYAADKHGENVKPVIITLNESFHGRTLATLAATGQDHYHHHFGPFPEGFMHVPPNDIAALEDALAKHPVCAVMLEVVQGEGGVEPLDAAYILAARKLTEARDVLLIIDEVQTGNGRLGTLFGYQQFGVMPDIVTTAKGLAGGLPMGACLLGGKVEHTLTAGMHASTFGGNPVCAAAAVAVMNQLTDELLSDVQKKGAYIRAELGACPTVQKITGYGLMLGIQTTKDARELVKTLLQKGVVTLTAKEKLRLLPPLTIPWEQLRQAVSVIKEVLL
ncbi:MAG: aminotransferase class III-fold pyridoxal phosphate-dependent enzyme, partial [Bacillota bacterium]